MRDKLKKKEIKRKKTKKPTEIGWAESLQKIKCYNIITSISIVVNTIAMYKGDRGECLKKY